VIGPSVLVTIYAIAGTLATIVTALAPRAGGSRRLLRTPLIGGVLLPWIYLLLARPWHSRWGATREEARKALPYDHFVPRPLAQTTRAVTIAAPPAAVWPWLVQMGWGRGAWYTARWVDRWLFPANGPSADRIVPELQDISIGTFIPDGKPETETGLHVVELQPERALVLRSNSHLPMSWRDRATLDWTWTFVLTPVDGGQRTRYHFRSRWVTSPWWFTLSGWLGIVPADFVMSRDHLRGVKRRAEKLALAA